jgi:hypothetical protein
MECLDAFAGVFAGRLTRLGIVSRPLAPDAASLRVPILSSGEARHRLLEAPPLVVIASSYLVTGDDPFARSEVVKQLNAKLARTSYYEAHSWDHAFLGRGYDVVTVFFGMEGVGAANLKQLVRSVIAGDTLEDLSSSDFPNLGEARAR